MKDLQNLLVVIICVGSLAVPVVLGHWALDRAWYQPQAARYAAEGCRVEEFWFGYEFRERHDHVD